MSEEREYQEKMLNSKKRIVFCNWERGSGKTFMVARKIMGSKKGQFVYISPSSNAGSLLIDKIKEDLDNWCVDIEDEKLNFTNSGNKVTIRSKGHYNDLFNVDVKIYIVNSYADIEDKIRSIGNIKYAFFDEAIPSSKQMKYIFGIGAEQIYSMFTNEDLEFIDGVTSKKNFYEKQIEELKIEYSTILKKENTTKTRESILNMIEKMEILKSRE